MLIRNQKKLAKLITATFALNSLGGAVLPVVSAAETATTNTTTTKATAEDAVKKAEQEKNETALATAKANKEAVEKAYSGIIDLDTDGDDDLQFLNKVISLCTDSTGKVSVADTYAKLMESAEDAADEAESQGKEPDGVTKKLVAMNKRVHEISNKISNAGVIDIKTVPQNVVNSAIKTYQTAIADKKLCEAQATKDGKDKSTCKLSDDGADAANFLLTQGLQQVNVVASSGAKTNATEQKGASTIKNKDTHWTKGDDGLWHETTNATEVKCGDDEVVQDGACVKKVDVKCADDEVNQDGKCVKKADVKCADDEVNQDGKCVKKTTSTECGTDEVLQDGKCVKKTDVKCAADEVNQDGKCVKTTTPQCKEGDTTCQTVTNCTDEEVLQDGKCVKKTDVKCADDEVNQDGKCVKKTDVKCADDEVNQGGKCVKKTDVKCADDEVNQDGKCVKKEDTSKCPATGYVESNGQCCPTDYPVYDSAQQQCVKKQDEQTTSGGKKSGNSDKLVEALGTIGALAGLFGGGGGGDTGKGSEISENQMQFTFNYLQGKATTTVKNKKGQKGKSDIYLFPTDSTLPIKFKLFQYRLPATKDGVKAQPKAVAHVMMTMYDEKTKKWTGKTITIPLTLNQMTLLFPRTTDEGGEVYLPLKALGTIEREPAKKFGLPYYTMTVVADDGVSGHIREFNIKYDFTSDSTYITANPDKNLKKGTDIVDGHAPTIGVDGFVQGATWDSATQTCRINVSGTFTDSASNEQYSTDGSGSGVEITSDRYNETGCGKIAKAAGYAIHMEGIGESVDSKGNRILSDKDASDAKIAVYDNSDVYKNDGKTKYDEGVLRNSDYKEEYQKDLVYSRRPVDFTVTYADGHEQSWAGYSSDGKTLYDTNGNELTNSQKAQEAKILCNATGDATYCSFEKVDACSANSEPDNLGKVCGFLPNGKEVVMSKNGFSRDTIEAEAGISKQNAEKASILNTMGATFNKAGKDGTVTLGHLSSVVGNITDMAGFGLYDKVVTVDEIAGTQDKDKADKEATEKANDAMTAQQEAVNKSNGNASTADNEAGKEQTKNAEPAASVTKANVTKNSDGTATVSLGGKTIKVNNATGQNVKRATEILQARQANIARMLSSGLVPKLTN